MRSIEEEEGAKGARVNDWRHLESGSDVDEDDDVAW